MKTNYQTIYTKGKFMKAHGIMFHHFHNETKHIKGQGSISATDFGDLLDYYQKDHNIIGAEEFLYRSENNSLQPSDVCLTFDDGLLCQYDIAYPVMKERGLTAFWFIYTSPLDGIKEKLEIYRHFRFSKFADVEDFYSAFFEKCNEIFPEKMTELHSYNPDDHYKAFPFYTPNDKRFRYLRDRLLGEKNYNSLMDSMLVQYNYDIDNNSKLLWLDESSIIDLYENGNIIGLHSYSHPTVMENKSYDEQYNEYNKNKIQLEKIINHNIISVSYPCNSYNNDTIKCMQNLDIKIGFRANMADTIKNNIKFEYPREDHANILKNMEKSK